MSEEKLSKIDRYLTARLYNHLVRRINGPLRTGTLMEELRSRYVGERMNIPKVQYMMLSSIKKAQERVDKKWFEFCWHREKWSKAFRTDVDRMHELMSRGIITNDEDAERYQIILRILGYLD